MPRKDAPTLVEGLEAVGQVLTDEERAEVILWEKGKALSSIVGGYGWDVVLEVLKDYEESSVFKLKQIDPSQKEEVLAEHAVMYAAARIYNSFVTDVQNAVDAAQHAPASVKRGIRMLQPGPPESLG
jgi:hypothetical protein